MSIKTAPYLREGIGRAEMPAFSFAAYFIQAILELYSGFRQVYRM